MPGRDYHWYRLNDDGTWSHKQGSQIVTDRVGIWMRQGRGWWINDVISDPRAAAYMIGYSEFLGFFMIEEIEMRRRLNERLDFDSIIYRYIFDRL